MDRNKVTAIVVFVLLIAALAWWRFGDRSTSTGRGDAESMAASQTQSDRQGSAAKPNVPDTRRKLLVPASETEVFQITLMLRAG